MGSGPAVCLLPRLEGLGGPASFRARLVAGLQARGVPIVKDPLDPACRSVLVIGGTRRISELLQARRRGVRIVQRLNGMNWIHRRRFTGFGHFLRSEINNLVLALIRRYLADRIIYQSVFSQNWWTNVYRTVTTPASVIYNSVDLTEFSPGWENKRANDRYTVLLVEGRLGSGYEQGLFNAAALVQTLGQMVDRPVELVVVGSVPDHLRSRMDNEYPHQIVWKGVVHRDDIPAIDRTAHVLFSADINAACPNSVIEALACGLPVVAFSTGSLPELIEGGAGLVVSWGSDYWKFEPPDISALAEAAQRVLNEQDNFRKGARARAEVAFDLNAMVERYLEVLLG